MAIKTVLFIQNYATDPPHLISQWLEELGLKSRTIEAYAGEVVPTVLGPEVVALIALGGAMNAMQDVEYPWLALEKTLLKKSVEKGLPVLGICLGAQLLGVALGGTISRLDKSEIGIYDINQVTPDPIINLGQSAPAAQWHEDYVSVLPQGATLIADSNLCPTQIYKVGPLSYGLQCHPEADASIVAMWEAKPDHAFRNFDKTSHQTTIASTVKARETDLADTWKPVIQSWGQAVLDKSSI